MALDPTEVFTPSSFPIHTYVERSAENLESDVRIGLKTAGQIMSVSGPSKSGKTVLVEKVVGGENLITVGGGNVSDAEQLWELVLDELRAPTARQREEEVSKVSGTEFTVDIGGGVPLLAEAHGGTTKSSDKGRTSRIESDYGRRGVADVIDSMKATSKVLLIDDYHYIDRRVQAAVARQIKDAAWKGLKICVATVPHRSDDVVRSNNELRGRLMSVDVKFWSEDELRQIADKGFAVLGVTVEPGLVDKLIKEASGSPQLMQALCLDVCLEMQDLGRSLEGGAMPSDSDFFRSAARRTASKTNYRALLHRLHDGPRVRGTGRNKYELADGTSGDAYRAVLLAIKQDPPLLSFSSKEMKRRLELVSPDEQPPASSVFSTCKLMASLSTTRGAEQVFEWDEELFQVDIADPYFLFYLRWSDELKDLAKSS